MSLLGNGNAAAKCASRCAPSQPLSVQGGTLPETLDLKAVVGKIIARAWDHEVSPDRDPGQINAHSDADVEVPIRERVITDE